MRLTFLGIVLLSLFACDSKSSKLTKISGQIVSPHADKIILLQDGKTIDSVPLKKDGRFSYEFQLKEEGVFFFRHHLETQMLYLKPGDSLVFRLNTIDFDESLTFGGDSSKENNFLIEHFLENEKNNNLILSYYKIEPIDFVFKTDSIREQRINQLKKLEATHKLTPYFKEIATKTLEVEYYDMRERFAFLMRKYFPQKALSIDNGYYAYRDEVNFDDKSMMNHIGYLRFLDNYLKNESTKHCPILAEDMECWNLNTYDNLKRRIQLVSELLSDESLKLRFYNRFISRELILASTQSEIDDALEVVENINFSTEQEKYLTKLADFQRAFLVDSNIGHIDLMNIEGESVAIKDISVDKPMLIYVWSTSSPNFYAKRFEQINKLKLSFPEIEYVGINIDYMQPKVWGKVLKNNPEMLGNQFQIIGQDTHKELYANYLNKLLFLTPDGTIKKGELMLNNINAETLIAEFITSFNK